MRTVVHTWLALGLLSLFHGCVGSEDLDVDVDLDLDLDGGASSPGRPDGGTSSRDAVDSGASDCRGGGIGECGSGNDDPRDSGAGDSGAGGGSTDAADAGPPPGPDTCSSPAWSPPASANGNTQLPAGLEAVWAHSGKVIMAADNIKMYQILANHGSLRYCARWDSTKAINAAERKQIEALIGRCDKQWTDKLAGWGCWPYAKVDVKVVLWAVKDKALLTGWSDTEGQVVVNSDASCPTDCGPWNPRDSFARCKTVRYDEFFWLDGSLKDYTGWGSATGFYMGADSFLNAAKGNAATETIVVHEMGHSHGLDDFYDWEPAGWKSWVMLAGSANVVTETDGWMVRDVWRHVRSKHGYPGP